MTTESEPTLNRAFHFQCPHCDGHIRFSVAAMSEPDYEDEDEDEVDEWTESAYYESMDKMTSLIRLRQYIDAIPAISANVEHLVEEFGEGTEPISLYIPAVEQGARLLALMGETERLNRMHEVVTTISRFRDYALEVEKHQREATMFQSIREAVRENPNCVQTDVKIFIGEADGRHIATLIGYLENAGEITRTRDGRKIRLSLR